MPPAQTFDGVDTAFRFHGLVRHRYEAANGDAVLDVELENGTLLSIRDPDERYPPELVGESRTLSVAIAGYQDVRPADREATELWTSDEGCAGVIGQRTAHCSWDGRQVAVPLDVAWMPVDVPLRETTRPAREAGAADEVVADAGIDDCEYVAVDDARLVVCDVDEDVDTDPYADTVHEDVTFEVNIDDDEFRSELRDGNALVGVPVRIGFDSRWFIGGDDQFGGYEPIGTLRHLAEVLLTVFEGEATSTGFLFAPTEFRLKPEESNVMRFNVTDRQGRAPGTDFPPDGGLVELDTFVNAVLDAIRDVLQLAWEVDRTDFRPIEELRQASIELRHALEARTDE